MKKLIVIEGFDRCGKDTLISDLKKIKSNFYIYENDLEGLPKYDKEKEIFLVWLNKFIYKQINDLNRLFKTYDIVIMCRLLISDEVYSNLFNREHTTIKYINQLNNVEIFNYCLLFKNYNEYLNRLSLLKDENIQYNKEDFEKINNLYKVEIEKFNNSYINYIISSNSKESILINFLKYYETISKI